MSASSYLDRLDRSGDDWFYRRSTHRADSASLTQKPAKQWKRVLLIGQSTLPE